MPCSAQGTTNAFLVVLHTADCGLWRESESESELAVVIVCSRAGAGDDADADAGAGTSVWRIVMSGRRWVEVDVTGIAELQVTRRRYKAKVVVMIS